MRWGTPKEYAWLHKVSLTQQYKTQLLFWLQWENPQLYKMVLKEMGRDQSPSSDPTDPGSGLADRKWNPDPAEEEGRRSPSNGANGRGEKDAGG